ncbi:methyltransferase domain-containing protein [bacterium]|nr:methyltransferase domain-containing protein [bacterium]MCK4437266.1 methyltransferase domain-containing protein [bacterium]
MSAKIQFKTNYTYRDRKTKAKYVYLKYQSILTGNILDVGADECYLRQYIGEGVSYFGIGCGDNLGKQVDLEKGCIPFDNNSFDCVLCLDVLEHLENIHAVFDELCRVSRRWVIISLPNPWRDFYTMLQNGDYAEGRSMKFYNLPLEPSNDRHKWFFSTEEAKKFIAYRAEKNRMRIAQIDIQNVNTGGSGIKRLLRRLAMRVLFRNSVKIRNFYNGALWAVLEKIV